MKGQGNGQGAWNDDLIWKAYELALTGAKDSEIAYHFNVDRKAIGHWKKKYKAFFNALKAARKKPTNSSTNSHSNGLREFVHGRLPDDLKPVWKEMMGSTELSEIIPLKRLNALIGDRKDIQRAKQTLWLYAWFECNFNQSEACRQIGVNYNVVHHIWKKDPDFLNLFNEMNRIKGDFFEGALVEGINTGNPYLIAFANKTFNRDRGYGESIDVNISGSVEHHHVISIDELKLPIDIRKQLLLAVREQQKVIDMKADDTGVYYANTG